MPACYIALQTINRERNSSAMNPVAMENASEENDKAIRKSCAPLQL